MKNTRRPCLKVSRPVKTYMDDLFASETGSSGEARLDWLQFYDQLANQVSRSHRASDSYAELQPSSKDLITSYDCTLMAFTIGMDQRELAREKHTPWLTEFTVEAAHRVDLPEFEIIHVRRGALLHDLGNFFIPEIILHKPGPLTKQEWELVHQHPVFAYRLMSPIPIFQQALDIPYSHHEHWDGSGYPLGLSEEEIPLTARIFAILDTWEALTHERPYRPAMAASQAMKLIEKLAGI